MKVNGQYGHLAILLWGLPTGREPRVEIEQRLDETCVQYLKEPDLLVLTTTNQVDPGTAFYY